MSDHTQQQHAPAGGPDNAGHTAGHEEVTHGHEEHAAATEGENLPIGKVVMVGVVSILIFAIGSVWALKMRTQTIESMNPSGAPALPASLGNEEQGIVDQIPFELNHWVKDDRAASARQLTSYGWTDQKAGTIHIPIERAIELQLADSAHPPAPAPSHEEPAAPQPAPELKK